MRCQQQMFLRTERALDFLSFGCISIYVLHISTYLVNCDVNLMYTYISFVSNILLVFLEKCFPVLSIQLMHVLPVEADPNLNSLQAHITATHSLKAMFTVNISS